MLADLLLKRASLFFKLAQDTYHKTEGEVFWGKSGSGILLVSIEDQTALLLKRSNNVQEPGTWGIPGGAVGEGEGRLESAMRESIEELGSLPRLEDHIDTITYNKGDFTYETFVYNVSLEEKNKWTPTIKLNWENDEYRWFPFNSLPTNLHFGIQYVKDDYKKRGIDIFEDPESRYDWLRYKLQFAVRNFGLPKDLIDKLVQETYREVPYQEDNEYRDNIDKMLNEIRSYFVSQKNIEGVRFIRDIKKKLFKETVSDWYKPKQERSLYEKYLYHGTTATDAISILKNNTFYKGTSFRRLSLSSSLAAAAKFGDVVFVFDGKKLQRRGATKLRYLSNKQISDLIEQDEAREAHKESKRVDLGYQYDYEKEWSLPLPFTFTDDELVKIVVLSYDKGRLSTKERIKNYLEMIIDKPVQLRMLPSYAPSGIQEESEDIEGADLKHYIFSEVVNPAAEFYKLALEYSRRYRDKIEKEYGKENIDYLMRTDGKVSLLNSIIANINHYNYIFKTQKYSRLDAVRFKDFYKAMESAFSVLKKYDYDEGLRNLISLMERIINSKPIIMKAFSDQFLNSDEKMEDLIKNYNGTYDNPFIPNIVDWIDGNVGKFKKIVESNNLRYSTKYDREDYRSVSDFMEYIDNVVAIPDEIWMRFPLSLIDNNNLYKMPMSRAENIFINTTELDGDIDDEWIRQHRLPYSGNDPNRIKAYENIMAILQKKKQVPQEVNVKEDVKEDIEVTNVVEENSKELEQTEQQEDKFTED